MPAPPPYSTSAYFHPLHAMLVPVPMVCFFLTLLTDIVYWKTAAMQWANMSAWLLAIGLIFALLGVLAGVVGFLKDPRIRQLRSSWVHLRGSLAAVVLSIFNALVHTRDAYTSVVPAGLILSALVVLILLVTGWNGWTHGLSPRRRHAPGHAHEAALAGNCGGPFCCLR